MFEGFSEETIRFFLELRFHNEVSFYKAHEEEYRQSVRDPFYSFIEALAPTVAAIAPDMELRPAKCLARIRRDTRFTKDKSPFRDHLWLLFRRACEEKEHCVTFWFELSPEQCNWGLGFWGENRPTMDLLRRDLREKPAEVEKALKRCKLPANGLELAGDEYKRIAVPEGLGDTLSALYRKKSLYIQRNDVPMRMVYTPEIVDAFAADLLRLKPMYTYLRKLCDQAIAELDPKRACHNRKESLRVIRL